MILFLARRNDMVERIQWSIMTGVKRCESNSILFYNIEKNVKRQSLKMLKWSTTNLNEVSNGNVLLT